MLTMDLYNNKVGRQLAYMHPVIWLMKMDLYSIKYKWSLHV